MLVQKITKGYVTQIFDTEKKDFVEQFFTAGDSCEYVDERGKFVSFESLKVDHVEMYLPYDMVQPTVAKV